MKSHHFTLKTKLKLLFVREDGEFSSPKENVTNIKIVLVEVFNCIDIPIYYKYIDVFHLLFGHPVLYYTTYNYYSERTGKYESNIVVINKMYQIFEIC